jgi:hypothetical protein
MSEIKIIFFLLLVPIRVAPRLPGDDFREKDVIGVFRGTVFGERGPVFSGAIKIITGRTKKNHRRDGLLPIFCFQSPMGVRGKNTSPNLG